MQYVYYFMYVSYKMVFEKKRLGLYSSKVKCVTVLLFQSQINYKKSQSAWQKTFTQNRAYKKIF